MQVNQNTKSWSKWKLLKFSFFTILIIASLLEIVFRVFFYIKYKGLSTSVYIQGSPLQQDDSLTVYNNRAYYVDYEKKFQYNELGMKSDCGDFKMPVKQKAEVWVLLLGGSAMEGMGSNKDGKWFDITNIPDHPYNETIAFYLQQYLRDKNPGKNIKVFNGAVSGFDIHQGFEKYKALSAKYNFDWVISMDGVNESNTLSGSEPEVEKGKQYWASLPLHKFPLRYIIPVTQHSALLNTIKQELYYFKMKRRMGKNESKGFPDRKFWLNQPRPAISYIDNDPGIAKAVNRFIRELSDFENRLKKDNKKYLLLVQPYLAFRDSAKLTDEEKALTNYLLSVYNDPYKFSFLRAVYDTLPKISAKNPHIQMMSAVHEWEGWTFVDYCHFTRQASRHISEEIGSFIVADSAISIFTKTK